MILPQNNTMSAYKYLKEDDRKICRMCWQSTCWEWVSGNAAAVHSKHAKPFLPSACREYSHR